MNHQGGTINVLNTAQVTKAVPGKDWYLGHRSKSAEERSFQQKSSYFGSGGKVTRGPSTKRTTPYHDATGFDPQLIGQVFVGRINGFIATSLAGFATTQAITRIIIGKDLDTFFRHFIKKGSKVANILAVAMTVKNREAVGFCGRPASAGNPDARFGLQVEVHLIIPAIGWGGGREKDLIAVKSGQHAKNKIDEEKEDEKPSPRYLCELLKVRHYDKRNSY